MNSFADFVWYMIMFYFVFMILWIFIRVFADIFHRTDLTGLWKVIWICVIFIVPFIGLLVYIISRPVTAQDTAEMAQLQQQQQAAQVGQQRAAGYSSADEIAKLTALRDSGAITPAEFETAKAKALA